MSIAGLIKASGRVRTAGFWVMGGGVAVVIAAFVPWVTALGFFNVGLSGLEVAYVLVLGAVLASFGVRLLQGHSPMWTRIALWVLAAWNTGSMIFLFVSLNNANSGDTSGLLQPAAGVFVVAAGILASLLGTILLQTVPVAPDGGLMLSDDRQFWWDGVRWRSVQEAVPPDAPRSPDRRQWWDGKNWRPITSGLQSPPSTAPSAPPQVAVRAGRRIVIGRRLRVLLGLGVVVIVLLVVANAFASSKFTPQSAVSDYLNAQAKGDVDGMWNRVVYNQTAFSGQNLLSKSALASMLHAQQNRQITNISITDAHDQGGGIWSVSASYSVGGTSISSTFTVEKDSSQSEFIFYPYWKLHIDPATISVSSTSGSPNPTVDGQTVSASGFGGSIAVIPGIHVVALPASGALAGTDQTVNALTNTSPSVQFTPTLSTAAHQAAQQAITSLFSQCTSTMSFTPSQCPNTFSPQGETQSNVKWTLSGDPTSGMTETATDPSDVAVAGTYAMAVSYDYQSSFLGNGSDSQPVTGSFTVDLHWNGTGFDVTSVSPY